MPRPVAPGISFLSSVNIDLPTPVNTKLWKKITTPEGWKKKRSAYKDRVTYRCVDINKPLTVSQWEEIRAQLLLITEGP